HRLGVRHAGQRARRRGVSRVRPAHGRDGRLCIRRHAVRVLDPRARAGLGARLRTERARVAAVSSAAFTCLVVLAAAGCATTSRVETLGELAGAWEGRFALRLANAAAMMEITPDGAYK